MEDWKLYKIKNIFCWVHLEDISIFLKTGTVESPVSTATHWIIFLMKMDSNHWWEPVAISASWRDTFWLHFSFLSYILSQQQSMISIWWQSALSVVHVYVEKALIIVCPTNISSFENVTVICPSWCFTSLHPTQVINDLWIIPKDYFSDLFWLLTATLNILNNKIHDNFWEKNAFGRKTNIKVYNTYKLECVARWIDGDNVPFQRFIDRVANSQFLQIKR